MLGKTFIIVTDSVDLEVVVSSNVFSGRCSSAVGKGYAFVHQEISRLWVFAEIQRVKALVGRHEFDHTFVGEDAEHPITITTVISDVIFFGKSKK